MTIAVTGGTGFVGRAVLSALSRRGLAARLLVRKRADIEQLSAGWDIVEGGLEDETALAALVSGADVLIHVAGIVAAIRPEDFAEHNARASHRLAELAAKNGVARMVYVSSLAAREPQLSAYAASKHAAEQAIERLDTAMARIIIRPPAVYGPGDKATLPLFEQLTRRTAIIPASSTCRFSLIHASDLAEALIEAAVGQVKAGTYELEDTTSGGYTWPQVAAIAGRATGNAVRIRFLPRPVVSLAALGTQLKSRLTGRPDILTPGKVRELYHEDWTADPSRRMKAGNWEPAIGFDEGFASTLAWYRAHGQLPIDVRRTSNQPATYPGDRPK